MANFLNFGPLGERQIAVEFLPTDNVGKATFLVPNIDPPGEPGQFDPSQQALEAARAKAIALARAFLDHVGG